MITVSFKNINTDRLTDFTGVFSDISHPFNLQDVSTKNINNSSILTLQSLFLCSSAKKLVLTNMKRPYVNESISEALQIKTRVAYRDRDTAESIFSYCNIDVLDISKLYTYNLKNLQSMFYNCKIGELNISDIDFREIVNFERMFMGAEIGKLVMVNTKFNSSISKFVSYKGMFRDSHIKEVVIREDDIPEIDYLSKQTQSYCKLLSTSNIRLV